MKGFLKIFFCCFLPIAYCQLPTEVFAQPSADEQLAFQYLQNKEFDKAVIYYEKLFNKKGGMAFYNPYILCMVKLHEFDKAEKVIKRTIKQYPQNLTYLVDL